MKRTIIAAALALCCAASPAFAEDDSNAKLKVTPTGRFLLDGAVFSSNEKDLFEDGVAIPDIRMGVKATYGSWKAKIDVGFAYGKISLKDVCMDKKFNDNMLLRFGNFVHQFGLGSATSSSMKEGMEEPTSNEVFGYPRLIGAMFVYDTPDYLGTASIHGESYELLYRSNDMGRPMLGAISRQLYRPLHETGSILQVGISGAASGAQYDKDGTKNHNFYSISAGFPTRVAKVTSVSAQIEDAKYMVKFTPELMMAYNNLAFESQYYWFGVGRNNGHHMYKAYGAYATVRALALGGNYAYSHADGGLATPAPGSLEFVSSFNYTNLSDKECGIYGGRFNDVYVDANWYINKYMIWRLRAGYSHRWDKTDAPNVNVGTFETRFQVIF